MPRGGALQVEIDGRALAFAGENCAPPASGEALPWEVEQSLRLLCLLQPVALVRRTLAGHPKLVAEGPLISAAREWVLRTPAPESYEVAFSRDLLPVELKCAMAQAVYSNYPPAKPYPRQIVIRVEKPNSYRALFLFDSVVHDAEP
jgi:hypothetical protein